MNRGVATWRTWLAIEAFVLVGVPTLPAVPVDTARAATYQVAACDAAGGVNNSWTPMTNNGLMAAYTACPAGGDQGRGILARASVQQGQSVPAGTFAQMRFDAPAGTSIVGLYAAYRFYRSDEHWQAALSTGTQLLKGCPAGGLCFAMTSANEYIPVPNSPLLYVEAYCAYGSCPLNSTGDPTYGYAQATANLFSATVVLEDDSAPSVGAVNGPLWSDGWKRGTQGVSFDASDNSGIRENRVLIDGQPVSRVSRACDFTVPIPCPQGGDSFSVDTSIIKQDGAHSLAVQALDSAGNAAQASRPIFIDNTPPSQPEQLQVDGGEDWRSTNAFTVRWRNPPQSGAAPIAGAEYELCPADGGACQRGSKSGKDLATIEGLKVPAAGDYALRLWLRDDAGNEDRKTAAQLVHLRFDDEPPAAAFAPQDPNEPTQLSVRVADKVSGLGDGTIELKKVTGAAWRTMSTQVRDGQLVALLDDERLHDGVYALRARVSDRAGNERSTSVRTDGSEADVALPVRIKMRIRAGVPRLARHRHHRKRRVLRSRVRVGFGRAVRLRGRLTSLDGTPLSDAEIVVLQRPRTAGAAFTPLATLRTSRTGRFRYRAPKGVSRELRFRYIGTSTIRPANGDVALRVRARTTLHANRRHFKNGQTIRFRGRLRGDHVPISGKLVELQVRIRGRFRTFATTRANQRGRWRYAYRFDGTRGRVIYRFRARVPREATYPYETGRSRRMTVVVRGS